jgi:mitochondrial protein MBA1
MRGSIANVLPLLQTLHVYDRSGRLMKDAGHSTPKRVVEYLTFEKRMWYTKPWVIRDQLYEDA